MQVTPAMIEALLLTTTRIVTYYGAQSLTNASGFFFARGERLFLVTSRHVMFDEPSKHNPDRLVIELHTDPHNMASSTGFSIPLYRHGKSLWRQGSDGSGEIDVAIIEIERTALPAGSVIATFGPESLVTPADQIEAGESILILGFPLGFHDDFHHLPVVRQAGIASSFGMRFQGEGYFLTDARTHRGGSGAPVVKRRAATLCTQGQLPWVLLGIHSARLDVGGRDLKLDEALGLNCAWYADILLTLTAD
ncbi:trypsin-like peptidase domain-containing protein [Uliginosibacterium sp. TH139]|uniref:trypsin-like peptidase domain-containing protein n=1 Tax=Uliginosibacterium sp. TH139 TaxID=2067453 RepID=UPI0020B161D0|nr:trypsin-like peptidase domain-containing protein [Uliginosibacterium sp. TH139]